MSADPWAPWSACAEPALAAVFEHTTFEAQVRALLDLAPKASAKEIAALPWGETHTKAEFARVRDAWAAERAVKRDEERQTHERPLDEVLFDQLSAGIRTGNLKDAQAAFALMGKVQASKVVRSEATSEDDFSRLTDVEALVLAALCHKLRDEPLTEFDANALEYLAALEKP